MSSGKRTAQSIMSIITGVLLIIVSVMIYGSTQGLDPLSTYIVLIFVILPLLLFGIYRVVVGLIPLIPPIPILRIEPRQKPLSIKDAKKHIRICTENICYELRATDILAYISIELKHNRNMRIAVQGAKESIKGILNEIRKALDEIEKNL